MTPLHASPTPPTLVHLDVKAADQRPLHGPFFLKLRRDADTAYRPVAVRARVGQSCRVRFVDVGWPRAVRPPAIRGAGAAARPPRVRYTSPAREWRGRSIARAASRLEIVLQFLVLATQPLALRFRAAQGLAQSFVVASELLDDRLRIGRSRGLVALRYAAVMPDRHKKYKSNHVEYVMTR
jgi:hypothetical protein